MLIDLPELSPMRYACRMHEEGLLSLFIGIIDSELEVERIGRDGEMLSTETGARSFGRGEGGYLAASSSCTA